MASSPHVVERGEFGGHGGEFGADLGRVEDLDNGAHGDQAARVGKFAEGKFGKGSAVIHGAWRGDQPGSEKTLEVLQLFAADAAVDADVARQALESFAK